VIWHQKYTVHLTASLTLLLSLHFWFIFLHLLQCVASLGFNCKSFISLSITFPYFPGPTSLSGSFSLQSNTFLSPSHHYPFSKHTVVIYFFEPLLLPSSVPYRCLNSTRAFVCIWNLL